MTVKGFAVPEMFQHSYQQLVLTEKSFHAAIIFLYNFAFSTFEDTQQRWQRTK